MITLSIKMQKLKQRRMKRAKMKTMLMIIWIDLKMTVEIMINFDLK